MNWRHRKIYSEQIGGGDGRFGSKVDQIGPKLDKFGTFYLVEPKYPEISSEKSRILSQFMGQSDHFEVKPNSPDTKDYLHIACTVQVMLLPHNCELYSSTMH